MMVLPSLFIWVMVSNKLRRARGSRPAVGSSRIRVSGFMVKMEAMAILRFWPPERLCGEWDKSLSIPIASTALEIVA